jgi:hypothetical protein
MSEEEHPFERSGESGLMALFTLAALMGVASILAAISAIWLILR